MKPTHTKKENEQRELKFRVWDSKAKFMKDDGSHPAGKPHMKYDVGVACYKWHTGVDGLHVPYNDSDLPLMQFTGLKDKNGKEIYEGDIINVPYNRIGDIVVKWKETGRWSICDYDLKSIEVIGNIYENPNLLNP